MNNISLSFIMKRFAFLCAAISLAVSPAMAQIQSVDPNDVIDEEVRQPAQDAAEAARDKAKNTVEDGVLTDPSDILPEEDLGDPTDGELPPIGPNGSINDETTYQRDDVLGAAEGVFGKGAEGLAKLIQDILKKQGQPNGYIVGREGGGAFIVGLRYGSGTLYHKVEGQLPVYWTGPSIGFDAGANAGSTFVLVYNLYDSEDLYKRFASAEGVAYLVGGFNASYLRRGDVVLIPIRVGAGLRLGANVGYMKMSKKRRWLPF